jgi:hypothetical protein
MVSRYLPVLRQRITDGTVDKEKPVYGHRLAHYAANGREVLGYVLIPENQQPKISNPKSAVNDQHNSKCVNGVISLDGQAQIPLFILF